MSALFDLWVIGIALATARNKREMIRELSKNDYNFSVLLVLLVVILGITGLAALGALMMFMTAFM
jgi:hypothetical protein